MTSKIRFRGATSGFVELAAPDAAGSNTLTLPTGNGTAGQYLQTSGTSGELSWQTVSTSNLTRETAVDTTSGTQIDFTNLPTGIRRITLVLDQVSVSTTNNIFVRLSTGGTFATTGYVSQSMSIQDGSTSASVVDSTQFVIINNLNAALRHSGSFTWHNITGNTWVMSGNCNSSVTSVALVSGGAIDLGGALDGLRFRIAGGTFDAGQINILYEV